MLISFHKSSSVFKVDIRQEVSPQKFCVHLYFLSFHMSSLLASFVFTILSTIGQKMLHCILSSIPPLSQPLLQIFSWAIYFQTLVICILLITGKIYSLFITEHEWNHLILGGVELYCLRKQQSLNFSENCSASCSINTQIPTWIAAFLIDAGNYSCMHMFTCSFFYSAKCFFILLNFIHNKRCWPKVVGELSYYTWMNKRIGMVRGTTACSDNWWG
jgi:hypothetical protein